MSALISPPEQAFKPHTLTPFIKSSLTLSKECKIGEKSALAVELGMCAIHGQNSEVISPKESTKAMKLKGHSRRESKSPS